MFEIIKFSRQCDASYAELTVTELYLFMKKIPQVCREFCKIRQGIIEGAKVSFIIYNQSKKEEKT